MNKKGTLFHWIFFIVLIALAVFFMYNNKEVLNVSVKGEWSTDFLMKNYIPAKKMLLENNIVAKKTAQETFWELAEYGGYSENISSDCGKYQGANLWNNGNTPCFPNANNIFNLAMSKNIQENSDKQFWNIVINNNFVSGKGDDNMIIESDNTYTFNDGFGVWIFYKLEDYDSLFGKATKLVNACNNATNSTTLKICLDENKPSSWKYRSCQSESYYEQARQVKFCAESPYNVHLLASSGQKEIVHYTFALDFTNQTTPSITT